MNRPLATCYLVTVVTGVFAPTPASDGSQRSLCWSGQTNRANAPNPYGLRDRLAELPRSSAAEPPDHRPQRCGVMGDDAGSAAVALGRFDFEERVRQLIAVTIHEAVEGSIELQSVGGRHLHVDPVHHRPRAYNRRALSQGGMSGVPDDWPSNARAAMPARQSGADAEPGVAHG